MILAGSHWPDPIPSVVVLTALRLRFRDIQITSAPVPTIVSTLSGRRRFSHKQIFTFGMQSSHIDGSNKGL